MGNNNIDKMSIKDHVLDFCLFEIKLKQLKYKGYLMNDCFPYEDKEHSIEKLKRYEDMEQYLKENLK